jgi:predicted TPR repeat methyltransferase
MSEIPGPFAPDATFELAKRHFFEGLAALQADRLEDAERAFLASLEAVPGRVSTLLNLGTTRLRMNRPVAAIAAADAVLALQPGDVDALAIRAVALARMGLHPQALAMYDRIVAAEPRLAEMWSQRGSLLREMGRLEEAAASYAEARKRGGDAELNDWFLAGVGAAEVPAAAPPDYVERLFDDYATDFDEHLVQVLGYRGHQLLVDNLPGLPGRRFASALDLGCGTGLCGPLLAPRVDRLTGVDLAGGMLERARALGVYERLERAEVVAWLEANGERFDLIVAADVLVYIGDLDPLFAAARRALADDGVFGFSIERQAGDAAAPFSLQANMRYTHSPRYVRELAARHGFTVVHELEATMREDRREAVQGIYFYLGASKR